ncbi:DUF5361 domain-containing protein [Trueperella sp. LYQ143]|uniref:DUF5361 domain-containing protein n=1 Tax=Trueperella sp. LYQ143 TaxID=3391059 RepID=UPI003982DC17
MAGSIRTETGGIGVLSLLLGRFRDEIEYELIRLGLRLRDVGQPCFNLRDLFLIVSHPMPGLPLERVVAGEAWTPWKTTDYLLASVLDCVRWLVWSKTRDGARGVNLPTPTPRPGMANQSSEECQQVRGVEVSVDEAADMF